MSLQQKIGRYALVKMIGRGGMADVWIGKVRGAGGFEKIVAVKILSPDQVDKEEYQRALTDEARVQVHLKHPNIVDIYDLNFEAENPYLVMEYVEGVELREVLRMLRKEKRTLPFPIAVFIVSEIAKALVFAHERNNPDSGEPLHIVHRDVSPSNILLSIHGDVKLSDFGIAKSSLQSGVTQVGQIKGKFRYMSPEQAEGTALDRRSDIFSLGLVFYECLFGAPAYEGPSDVTVLQMARAGEVVLPKEIDPRLHKILSRLIAQKAEGRYGNLREFAKDLADFTKSIGEMADRESLSQYLCGLDLARFHDAATARRQAEAWSPETTSNIKVLDQTGRIVTLAGETKIIPGRRWRLAAGIAGLVLILGTAAVVFRAMNRGQQGTSELPKAQVASTAPATSQTPVTAPAPEPKKLRVSFNADPYAEVSIPGQFSDIETPASKSLPPGDYTVAFRHAASGRTATARLKGANGGSYVCVADMAVSDPSQPPTASCRGR